MYARNAKHRSTVRCWVGIVGPVFAERTKEKKLKLKITTINAKNHRDGTYRQTFVPQVFPHQP